MNKLLKVFSLVAIALFVAVAANIPDAQALRAVAAPEPLPYGITMQDTMASVEQRLGQPKIPNVPQAGWEPGLPDGGGSPDYLHYYAVYKRFGLTVVYNSPSPDDKGATIQAIYIHPKK